MTTTPAMTESEQHERDEAERREAHVEHNLDVMDEMSPAARSRYEWEQS